MFKFPPDRHSQIDFSTSIIIKLGAEELAEWIKRKIRDCLVNEERCRQDGVKWRRINSININTYTCSSMGKAWEILGTSPELQHFFSIPCNSHG